MRDLMYFPRIFKIHHNINNHPANFYLKTLILSYGRREMEEGTNLSQLGLLKKKGEKHEEIYNVFNKVAIIQSDIVCMFKWVKARDILEHDSG